MSIRKRLCRYVARRCEPGGGTESLREFILTLRAWQKPHGRPIATARQFRSARYPARARFGQRVPELLREKLWLPLGGAAKLYLGRHGGTARTAGGISVTPRDLARVGEMMRTRPAMPPRRTEAWVRDTVATWRSKPAARHDGVPVSEGRYRNKVPMGAASGAFCGIGIHGQWLYVNPGDEVVIAKMSSQRKPVDYPLELRSWLF